MSWRWQNRDTWADRTRGLLLCSWRGHRWHRKMRGAVCVRCARFTEKVDPPLDIPGHMP